MWGCKPASQQTRYNIMNLRNSKEPSIHTKKLTRQQWLQARQSGIGGSDIAALMGESSYKTPYDVYQSKIREISEAEAEEMSEAAEWGQIMEPVIAARFTTKKGIKVQNVNFIMRHPDYDWAIANIDRAVVNPEIMGNVRFKDGKLTTDGMLEVKTASSYVSDNWGTEGTDEVPDEYMCQGQWYLGVTGCQYCWFAVLIGGNEFRVYYVERNQTLIDILFDVARDFWINNVLAGVEPDPSSLENAKHKYSKCNPDTTIEITSIDQDKVAILDRYIAAKAAVKAAEREAEDAQTAAICLIGDNETLKVDNQIVLTYKNSSTTRLDSKGIKKDYPELAEKYSKVSYGRTMRIK